MGFFSRKDTPSSGESASIRNKRDFMSYCDRRGTKYQEVPGREEMVKLVYGGGDFCFSSLSAFVDFDPANNGEGSNVHVVISQVANFTSSNRARGLEICNKIIKEKRWVKPYIDKDGDIMVDADLFVSGDGAVGEHVHKLVGTAMSIMDDVYQEIQQARWS